MRTIRHRIIPLLALLALIALGLPSTTSAVTVPRRSLSYYVLSTSSTAAYNAGHSYGQAVAAGTYAQTGIVVLDFGATAYQSSGGTITSYGALTYSGAYLSTTVVASLVEQFGRGYWIGTGLDTSAFLYVAAGVNNNSPATISGHGGAWANMVDTINSWFVSGGYASQTAAYGAMDIESHWPSGTSATYSQTKAWADGYSGQTNALYEDFGSANGCPETSYNNATCSNGWTQKDYWYVSWGAARAVPFPEIYDTTPGVHPPNHSGWTTDLNALQWHAIAIYAVQSLGSLMFFSGSFTQDTVCNVQHLTCPAGTNNTYSQGYNDLYYALNDDSRIAQTTAVAGDIKRGY